MPLKRDLQSLRNIADEKLAKRRAAKLIAAKTKARGKLPEHSFTSAIYFGNTPDFIYQLQQWYEPMRQLAASHPMVVIARNAATAAILMDECPMPVVHLDQLSEIEPFLAKQSLEVVFYLNNVANNSHMLANPGMLHVAVGHGESDKTAPSASNNFKAYDYMFVAGPAAVNRLKANLLKFDADERAIMVGRPQVDVHAAGPTLPADDRITVLYAPTWEGDKPSNRYGSVKSHGQAIVTALLKDPKYRVIFRPHPISGSKDPSYAAARAAIDAQLLAANQADPSAGHMLDTATQFGWHCGELDVCIADISSVSYDWLATRKPLILTRPAAESADLDPAGLAGRLPLLPADQASTIIRAIEAASLPEAAELNARTSEYYFGDTTPGASMARFLTSAEMVFTEYHLALAARDQLRADIHAVAR